MYNPLEPYGPKRRPIHENFMVGNCIRLIYEISDTAYCDALDKPENLLSEFRC